LETWPTLIDEIIFVRGSVGNYRPHLLYVQEEDEEYIKGDTITPYDGFAENIQSEYVELPKRDVEYVVLDKENLKRMEDLFWLKNN
jgi:hypothetical protein